MKIVQQHSHLNGLEWLMVHQPATWAEVQAVITAVDASKCLTKVSEEQGKIGTMLYSPLGINKAFKDEFTKRSWHESRASYFVTDEEQLIRQTLTLDPQEQRAQIVAAGKTAIRSYNQTDFVKGRVAVEVQLGKYSFIAYDLFVKHMAFYVGDKIDLGIEILPVKDMQSKMSSGPGYYEGALYDIVRQGRGVPAVPLVLLGVAE